jgi:hypothetical protein
MEQKLHAWYMKPHSHKTVMVSKMKSASENVDTHRQYEDSEDDEEKEGVDDHGLPIGGAAAKFDVAAVPG